MQARARYLSTRLLVFALTAAFLLIAPQHDAAAQEGPAFTQQELDQMLAPIALYPDALLSQIMMASTYPLEVVEAERWSVANPNLRGSRAVQAVERNNWDPSVKSLVAFPQILRMMSDKLDWTERLGDAFLDQEQQVMDTIQDLRQRAYRAGNLRSNDWARVDLQGDYIAIDLADPYIAYEPYYDPSVVYGSWWWPQYPPVLWARWPGYRERSGFGAGFAWGVGITLGAEFFYGAFDWRQHRVNVVNVNNNYRPRDARVASRASNTWQHDPDHRRGAPYRAPAVRAKFTPPGAPSQARSNFRGHLPAVTEQRGEQAGRPGVARPDTRVEPVKAPETRRPEPRPAPERPSAPASQPIVPQVTPRPHALEHVDRAAEARDYSARGRASREAPVARPVPSIPAVRAVPAAPVVRAVPAVPPPRPPERAAAPPPPPHAAAPAPAAAAPRAPEHDRKGHGKAPDNK